MLRLVLIALVSTTAIYGLVSIHAQYEEAIRDTHMRAEATALLLEEHALRTVDAADQVILRARDLLAGDGMRDYGQADWQTLNGLRANLPPVAALGLFDRDGRMLLTTREFPSPEYSIADRDYYRDHRHGGLAFVIGQAVHGRTSVSKPFFTVSRSVIGKDGSFQGVIAAAIDVSYFSDLYQRLNLGENAALAMLRTDGALLLREPFSSRLIGPGAAEKIRAWQLFTNYLDRGITAASYEGPSTADDLHRTYAFRRLDRLPLVVLVMLAHQDEIAKMMPGILRSAGMGATVLAFLVALTGWSFRLIDREDRIRKELANANRCLAAALEDAEAASRAKSVFLSNMSHELRTPLNAIIGFAEAMREGYAGETTPRQQEYLGDIREAGRHLLDIISEVLDLSKVASGALDLQEDLIEPRAAVEAAVAVMRDKAAVKSICIECQVPPDLPLLKADSLRCKQVLINLLSNAVKFTPPGGRVTVSTRVKDGAILFKVSDTGLGMHPHDIASAVEMFGRLASSPTKAQGGAGIGLPLAKKLVELHGGHILVDSGLGRGTCVEVTFPAERTVAPAAEQEESQVA